MARKIGILEINQEQSAAPQTYVKRSVAEILVRRLLAEWVVKNVLIRRLFIKSAQAQPARFVNVKKPKPSPIYEHHIEPSLKTLTISNSPWLQYLHGYQ